MAETRKARQRREREGFFQAFIRGRGIDIGVGRIDSDGADPITPDVDTWDKDNGDATFMFGVPDQSYDFVYTSHILEHLQNGCLALANWWRILKPGGHLIIYLPHRDLYEKRTELPSRWNPDHKFFFLPDREEPPCTLSLRGLVACALPAAETVYLKECSEGHTISDPDHHSDGEYSIEMVLRKPQAIEYGPSEDDLMYGVGGQSEWGRPAMDMVALKPSFDGLMWVTGLAQSDEYALHWPERFLWDQFHVPEDGVFVDAAACCGEHTLRLARWCSRVIAIEPMLESREVLTANLAINQLRNVRVVGCAIGAEPGSFRMTYAGNISHVREDGERTVEVRTLDEILADEPRVDTINLDIEGSEDLAILGMEKTLARLKPRLIVETHQQPDAFGGIYGGEDLLHRVRTNLERFGYRMTPVPETATYWIAEPA